MQLSEVPTIHPVNPHLKAESSDPSIPTSHVIKPVHSHSSKSTILSSSPATFLHRKRSESSMIDPSGPTLVKQTRVWNPPLQEHKFSAPPGSVPQTPEKSKTPETDSSTSRLNGDKPKPIPDTTICMICHDDLISPIELQVHLRVDHFKMRDGAEYRCPMKNCGLNCDTLDRLRNHVRAHYENEQKKLLEEKHDDEVAFPIEDFKTEEPSSPTEETPKFTTPFKLISDHHEIYIGAVGPSTSEQSSKTPN